MIDFMFVCDFKINVIILLFIEDSKLVSWIFSRFKIMYYIWLRWILNNVWDDVGVNEIDLLGEWISGRKWDRNSLFMQFLLNIYSIGI